MENFERSANFEGTVAQINDAHQPRTELEQTSNFPLNASNLESVTYSEHFEPTGARIPQMYEPYQQQPHLDIYGGGYQARPNHTSDFGYHESQVLGLNDMPRKESTFIHEPEPSFYSNSRPRTVTMDSILNTVTSEASINPADLSTVYSALSHQVNHNKYGNENLTPPLTPHSRNYSFGHGLSNLNPDYQPECHQQSNQSIHYDRRSDYIFDYQTDYYSNDSHHGFNRSNDGFQSNTQHFMNQNSSFSPVAQQHQIFDGMTHQQYQPQPPQQHQRQLYHAPAHTVNENIETYSLDENNRPVRIYKCEKPHCTKVYKNANGLKYHVENGTCEVDSSSHDASMFNDPSVMEDMARNQIKLAKRPYWCRIIGCGKRYKNLNGLKYHGKVAHPELDFTRYVKGHHAHLTDDDPNAPNANGLL